MPSPSRRGPAAASRTAAARRRRAERPPPDGGRAGGGAGLAAELSAEPIAAVYSSPYPRARETVAPLAAALGLPIAVLDDLRERLLSPDPLADWLDALRRSFDDPDYALPGGESGRQAAERVAAVLDDVANRNRGQTVVCASHGNLLALALRRHDPAIGFEFWRGMPMPAVYRMVVR